MTWYQLTAPLQIGLPYGCTWDAQTERWTGFTGDPDWASPGWEPRRWRLQQYADANNTPWRPTQIKFKLRAPNGVTGQVYVTSYDEGYSVSPIDSLFDLTDTDEHEYTLPIDWTGATGSFGGGIQIVDTGGDATFVFSEPEFDLDLPAPPVTGPEGGQVFGFPERSWLDYAYHAAGSGSALSVEPNGAAFVQLEDEAHHNYYTPVIIGWQPDKLYLHLTLAEPYTGLQVDFRLQIKDQVGHDLYDDYIVLEQGEVGLTEIDRELNLSWSEDQVGGDDAVFKVFFNSQTHNRVAYSASLDDGNTGPAPFQAFWTGYVRTEEQPA